MPSPSTTPRARLGRSPTQGSTGSSSPTFLASAGRSFSGQRTVADVLNASKSPDVFCLGNQDNSRPGSANVLANYVPRYVLDQILTLRDHNEIVHHREEQEAAAMCIDIVGFTALTEALSRQGSAEGGEKIAAVLNTFFGQVLTLMEQFSADVIQFSGDAIMALFSTHAELETNTILCYKCGQAIAQAAGTAIVSLFGTEVDVSLKVGIAAGPVVLMITGGYRNRWLPLVGGEAWNEAGIACDFCKSAHVFVHPSAKNFLFGKVGSARETGVIRKADVGSHEKVDMGLPRRGVMLGPPFADVQRPHKRPPPKELSAEGRKALKCFLFKGVVKAQRTDVRNVVSIFIKFCGIDVPSQDNEQKLRSAAYGLQRMAHRHDGVCNKFIFDDKGLVALMFFGVPMHMHANDSERACNLAVDAIESLEEAVGRICVGITRDKVYCGSLGNEWRAEYTVLGDSVNLSARLMHFGYTQWGSESCVVVDEVVAQETAEVVEYRDTRGITVKGKNEPVEASTIDLKEMQHRLRAAQSPRSSSAGSRSPLAARGSVASSVGSRPSLSARGHRGLRGPGGNRGTLSSTTDLWGSASVNMLTTEQFRDRMKRGREHSVQGSLKEEDELEFAVVGRHEAKRAFSTFVDNVSGGRGGRHGSSVRSPRSKKGLVARTPVEPSAQAPAADAKRNIPLLSLGTYVGRSPVVDPLGSGAGDSPESSARTGVDKTPDAPSVPVPGDARVFMLRGSVGMGRSTLLRYFSRECAKQGTPCITISGLQSNRQSTYSGVTQLLRRIAGAHEEGVAWLKQAVSVNDLSESLVPAIERLLPDVGEANGTHPVMLGEQGRKQSGVLLSALGASHAAVGSTAADTLRDVVFAALLQHGIWKARQSGAAPRTLIVIVDDVQWFDASSLKVLLEAHELLGPGMEMVTTGLVFSQQSSFGTAVVSETASQGSRGSNESDSSESVLRAVLKGVSHVSVELEGMLPAEAALHYKNFLSADSLEPALLDTIMSYSDGNPFVAEQILTTLLECNFVGLSADGEATLLNKDLNFGDVMSGLHTIEAMMLKSLDALAETIDHALLGVMKVCCVIGRVVDLQLLRLVFADGSSLDVDRCCEQLEAHNVLVRKSHGSGSRSAYHFRSSTLALVQYNNLIPSERKELHYRVAQAMEVLIDSEGRGACAFTDAEVGRHFQLGDEPAAAVRWYAIAVPEAIASENWETAASLLAKCVALQGGGLASDTRSRTDASRDEMHHPSIPGEAAPSSTQAQTRYLASGKEAARDWSMQLLDLHAVLGDWAAALPSLHEQLGFGPRGAAPAAEQEQRRRLSTLHRLCGCCLPRAPVAESDELGLHRVACDVAMLSGKWALYCAAAPPLVRALRKSPEAAAVDAVWWLGVAQQLAAAKGMAAGHSARESAEQAWRAAAGSGGLAARATGSLSALAADCAFAGREAVADCMRTPAESTSFAPSSSPAAAGRMRYTASVWSVVLLVMRGARDDALHQLNELLMLARSSRSAHLFLSCVLLGRTVKLLFVVPEDAPRVVSSAADLCAMLGEREWACAAEDGLEASAAALVAAEPTCAADAPEMRRRQSRLGTARVEDGTATRDPIALLCRATEHLELRGPVHLTPFLLPTLLLMVDTAVWLALRRCADGRLYEVVFPEIARHTRALATAFPQHALGLAELCAVATARFRSQVELSAGELAVLEKQAAACRSSGLNLMLHRLLLAQSHLPKSAPSSTANAAEAEGLQRELHIVPIGWRSGRRRSVAR
eukprot:TRINITY_DN46857_c0_g1_i1.p1 TRINITY_DN46857_c0_g1~~TRINITY_DN46857_c0_g1_i1.p1  ORF type:complete len:1754 (+),score=511.02 TRINITY_DN46857_c0_g1_i1:212-5473(+)